MVSRTLWPLEAHDPVIVDIENKVFFCEGKNVIQVSQHIQKNYHSFNFKFSIDLERQTVTYKSEDFPQLNYASTLLVAYSNKNSDGSEKPTIVAHDHNSIFAFMQLSGKNFSYHHTVDGNTWLISAICDSF